MVSLSTKIIDEPLNYDGRALSPHWIYRHHDLLGNALVAFQGKADVNTTHMVDLEDVKKVAPIYSPLMLHFIGEFFIESFDLGIALQHFFVASIYGSLWEKGIRNLRRSGNDLFFEDRKLSVSIAAKTPISVVFHTGINILTEATPVPTAGLRELGVDPHPFAQYILSTFVEDNVRLQKARVKTLARG